MNIDDIVKVVAEAIMSRPAAIADRIVLEVDANAVPILTFVSPDGLAGATKHYKSENQLEDMLFDIATFA